MRRLWLVIRYMLAYRTKQVLRGIGLVYGGGSVGLMGMVSRVVSDGGEDVLG